MKSSFNAMRDCAVVREVASVMQDRLHAQVLHPRLATFVIKERLVRMNLNSWSVRRICDDGIIHRTVADFLLLGCPISRLCRRSLEHPFECNANRRSSERPCDVNPSRRQIVSQEIRAKRASGIRRRACENGCPQTCKHNITANCDSDVCAHIARARGRPENSVDEGGRQNRDGAEAASTTI
jgi:hypothetical protein